MPGRWISEVMAIQGYISPLSKPLTHGELLDCAEQGVGGLKQHYLFHVGFQTLNL